MKNYSILLSLFFLIGCGAKKIDHKHEEKKVNEETKEVVNNDVTTDTNVKTEIKTFVVDSTKEEIEEIEITPIDNLKPAIFEGKEITNSKVIKRKINRNKALKSESNTNTYLNEKTADKTNKTTLQSKQTKENVESKNLDRKQFDPLAFFISYWWLWLILALIVFLLKKFRYI